jgi:hypothetical protein
VPLFRDGNLDQVAALELELKELRQLRSSRTFALPDIFSGLGLEKWREERLLLPAASASSCDIEAAAKKDIPRPSIRCAAPL